MLKLTPNTQDDRATQLLLPLEYVVMIEEKIRFEVSLRSWKAYIKKTLKGHHDHEDLRLNRSLLIADVNQITSLREIEAAFLHDNHFIGLGQGIQHSHMTLQRLIIKRLNGRFEAVLIDINIHLIAKEAIQTDVLYIDGTKFEANAAKNSFIWR